MSDETTAIGTNTTAATTVSSSAYVRAATHEAERLHRFAFEVDEVAAALSKSRRLECAVPKPSATSWPERERFLTLLSPHARRLTDVVLPSPKRAPYTWRVVDSAPGASAAREQERRARAFRRRVLMWFAPSIRVEKGEPAPAPVLVRWPPDGSDLSHLAQLPAPRLPSPDLEWRICEAPALLGARSVGGFERGGSSNPADTFDLHVSMRKAIKAVERCRRIDESWRQVPKWAQDVIVVYYSTDRLEEKQSRIREDAPHRRASALQVMVAGPRLAKVAAWLRANGIRGVSPEEAVTDAHKAWEDLRGQAARKRRESAREAAKREREEAVERFLAEELGS